VRLFARQYGFRSRLILLALVGCLVAAGTAHAHKVKLFAYVEDGFVAGYAYVPSGDRIGNASIAVRNQAGEILQTVTTDGAGDFRFPAPEAGPVELVMTTADGHRASWTVSADELGGPQTAIPEKPSAEEQEGEPTPSAVAGSSGAEVDLEGLKGEIQEIVRREIRPVRQQLLEYEDATRIHDIVGGIGYIAGVFGLVFFLKGRKRP